MKLIADENFPRAAVKALRDSGLDVLWIAETSPGLRDEDVLELSVASSRILITFDKDFGELAFRANLTAECGIVLFRVWPQDPTEMADLAIRSIPCRSDWAGHFSVITREKIRMRPIPQPTDENDPESH